MADYTDKFTGKQFIASTFSALSASLAAASDNKIDGRLHEELVGKDAIAKLPFRIKQGDQAKFFPGLKEGTSDGRIETGSAIHPIRDTVRQIVYVPIKKKNYQENLIGVNSHVSSTFASGAYLQVSAAFADLYSGVADDTIFTFGVEEFYTPTGSFATSRAALVVGQMTASFDIFESSSNSASFSAIDMISYGGEASGSKRLSDFEIRFPTGNFITHWALRFDNSDISIFYSSSVFIESVFARFGGGNNDASSGGPHTSSFNLTDNQFLIPGSGSEIARSNQVVINKTNGSDGIYQSYTFKSRLAGDADSGSLYNIATQFPGVGQIIVYPRGTHSVIGSGSFSYNSSSRNAATGSTEYKTLYFYSGSGATTLKNEAFGFFVTGAQSRTTNDNYYTPIHADPDLRSNAEVGFYSPSGSVTSSILVQTASGVTSGKGPVFAQQLVL